MSDDRPDGYGGRTDRYPLSRGHVKVELIRALATMEHTQKELAERYGVQQSSIMRFRDRHMEEIIKVRDALDDKFAGLWVADKAARVAEYQADIDGLHELAALDGGELTDTVPELVKLKAVLMRQVAEELGQLPARVTHKIEGEIRTIIVGVDPDVDLT